MTAFQYVEFYDVPRCILIRHQGVHLLLQSWFDEELDEYSNVYSVYKVPTVDTQLISFSLEFFQTPMEHLGEIPINRVTFDASKRQELDASVLDEFVDLVNTSL